jgi:hypothetical protein
VAPFGEPYDATRGKLTEARLCAAYRGDPAPGATGSVPNAPRMISRTSRIENVGLRIDPGQMARAAVAKNIVLRPI